MLRGRLMTRRIKQLAIASVVLVAAVAMVSIAAKRFRHIESSAARGLAFKKGDPDREPGEHKRALAGVNDERWPDYTAEVEGYLLRAYPEAEVPGEATLAALAAWKNLNAGSHSAGSWQLIGPSKATYPAV